MPFIAPAIAAAVGVGVIGEIVIGAGLSLALGAASRALAPKPKEQSTGGMRLSLRTEANGAREWLVGRAATAGALIYHQVSGPNGNDRLQLAIQLADHECDGLETVYVNGVAAAWNSTTGEVTGYPGMVITFHSGAAGQAADAALIAQAGGRWTADDRGTGLCYVVIDMTYSQTVYPTGLPKFLFVLRGAKLYDIRKDSTAGGSGSHRWGTPATYEWSDNPAVIAFNYARGVWQGPQRLIGMNAPASALPAAEWIAAANLCDETVAILAGGTEKRYRANGVISSATSHREVLADITRATAGLFIETGGLMKIRPGAARTAVASLTDDDLLEDGDIEIVPKRPRSQLVNAVFGSYHEPAQQFEMVALPPRLSPADEAADGNIRLEEHYALDLVTSSAQGQRILEAMRRRARYQRTVKLRLPPRFALLEAGDWIGWESSRYGWNTFFEVTRASVGQDFSITLDVVETAAAIYGFGTGDELIPEQPGTLPSGGPIVSTIPGLTASAITVATGTSQRPGITATWSPITDPTVTALRIEYRHVGDTVALEVQALQPSAGTHTWVNGIQGEAAYEIRAIPVTLPVRPTTWSAWIAVDASTSGQVVSSSVSTTTVTSVPDNSITPAKLSEQARREIELVTATADLQGSVAEQIQAALGWAQRAAEAAIHGQIAARASGVAIEVERRTRSTELEALAEQITTVTSNMAQAQALILSEQSARVTGDTALAQDIQTVSTTVGGHTASISTISASIDGYSARWSASLTVDGLVTGFVSLDGSGTTSTFGVLASTFYIAQPGVTGGDPITPFVIGTRNSVPAMGFDGDFTLDGTITARHLNVVTLDAIAADVGILEAGTIRSASGGSYWNLTTGDFQIGA